MEAREIMRLVQVTWPFTTDEYPLTRGMSDNERRIFAIAHVLKHQAKSMEWALTTHDASEFNHQPQERIDRARKFIVNSIRFAGLINVDPDRIVDYLDEWTITRNTSERVDYKGFIPELFGFSNAIHRAFGLIEPADHGKELPLDELSLCSDWFLGGSINFGRLFSYSRTMFEDWLEIHARNLGVLYAEAGGP